MAENILLGYILIENDPDDISVANSLLQCAIDPDNVYMLILLDPETNEACEVLISGPFTLLEHDSATNSLVFSCSATLGRINGRARLSPDGKAIGKAIGNVTIAI